MTFRALRTLGVLFLFALQAGPARTADAATPKPKTTVQAGAHARSHRPAQAVHSRRHRRRRPPPGGVYARNAILIDPSTGEVLFEKNSARAVPIASLTKLMTALVFLEQKPDLDREVEVTRSEIYGAGHTQLRRGEKVALGDLLHMSLMCSDNVATRVIARESGLPPEEFVARMNHKAAELGLPDSRFVEFTGLDEHNVSTAADVARMLHAAAHDPLIQQITTTREYEFRTLRRRARDPQHGSAAVRQLGRARWQDRLHPGGRLLLRDVDPHPGPRPDRGRAGRAHQRDALRGRGAPAEQEHGGRGGRSRILSLSPARQLQSRPPESGGLESFRATSPMTDSFHQGNVVFAV